MLWPNTVPSDTIAIPVHCMLLQNYCDRKEMHQIPARAVYCMLLQNYCDRTQIHQILVRPVYYMLLQNYDRKEMHQIPARAVYCMLLQNYCDRKEMHQIPATAVCCMLHASPEWLWKNEKSIRYQLDQCTLHKCFSRIVTTKQNPPDTSTARCFCKKKTVMIKQIFARFQLEEYTSCMLRAM